MFSKLKLKLTITNVVVVGIIFFIFTLGIFLLMQKITHDQTDQFINLISSNAGLTKVPENPNHNQTFEHQYRYFYVKLDAANEITSTSPMLDRENKQLKAFVSYALAISKNSGKVEFDNESYQFVKNHIEGTTGSSIVFVNTHSEHELLDDLILVLIIACVFGIILAFFASLYMAGRALVPIKESFKRQKDFVADASHELRTPLSVIETTLDLVISKKDKTIDSQIKWLENIHTENKRMTKLVNDLLFLARSDSEQVKLEMKPFPLHTALLEVYIPFEALALEQGIHLDPFESTPVDFYGDEARIKQLAVILIDNAIKYTSSGGHVGMMLQDLGQAVELTVSDTGEGISNEHINKIFQRFYRVDKARSRKSGSVGLGLSIAEWIVMEHRGSIKVESAKGEGTIFHITFPKVIY